MNTMEKTSHQPLFSWHDVCLIAVTGRARIGRDGGGESSPFRNDNWAGSIRVRSPMAIKKEGVTTWSKQGRPNMVLEGGAVGNNPRSLSTGKRSMACRWDPLGTQCDLNVLVSEEIMFCSSS